MLGLGDGGGRTPINIHEKKLKLKEIKFYFY